MNGHVASLLSGYLDNELDRQTLRMVENHLAGCGQCQAELHRMRSLSILLRQSLPAPAASANRFLAHLDARLPRRSRSAAEQMRGVAWGLLPGGLVFSWGFVQALFVTAFLVSLVLGLGWLPGVSAALPGSSESPLGLLLNPPSFTTPLEIGGFLWRLFTLDDALLGGFTLYVALNLGIGLLLLAWVAGWYVSQRRLSLRAAER